MARLCTVLGYWLGVVAISCASPGADSGREPPLTGTLRLSGSTTVYPLARAAADAFADQQPGVHFEILQSSTGEGLAEFIAGHSDIATATRPPTEAEYEAASRLGRRPRMTIIANDALAVVVHPSNPLADVSLAQLEQIFFTGEIHDWAELTDGAKTGTIRVYHTNSKVSGTADLFESVVLGRERVPYVSGSVEVHRTPNVVTSVADDPSAIAYTPVKWVADGVRPVTVAGMAGTERTIVDGSYPFSRRLYFVTDGMPTGLTRAFITFVLGTTCQQTVTRYAGFIPVL